MTFISAKAINRLNVKLNTFATYRSLNMYLDAFDKQFEEALNSLDSYSHWIDVGAGQARAQLQFLGMNLAISPKMTAIGITEIILHVAGKPVDQTISHLIKFLKPGGKLFVQPLILSMKIVDVENNEIPLSEWINSFQGVKILEKDGVSTFYNLFSGLKLQATGEEVHIPELELVDFRSGLPPYKVYRWRR